MERDDRLTGGTQFGHFVNKRSISIPPHITYCIRGMKTNKRLETHMQHTERRCWYRKQKYTLLLYHKLYLTYTVKKGSCVCQPVCLFVCLSVCLSSNVLNNCNSDLGGSITLGGELWGPKEVQLWVWSSSDELFSKNLPLHVSLKQRAETLDRVLMQMYNL